MSIMMLDVFRLPCDCDEGSTKPLLNQQQQKDENTINYICDTLFTSHLGKVSLKTPPVKDNRKQPYLQHIQSHIQQYHVNACSYSCSFTGTVQYK